MNLRISRVVSAAFLAASLTVPHVFSQVVDADEFAQRIDFCEQRSNYVAEMIDMKRRNLSAVDAYKKIHTFDPLHYGYLIKTLRGIWNSPWDEVPETADERKRRYIENVVLNCVRSLIPEAASE